MLSAKEQNKWYNIVEFQELRIKSFNLPRPKFRNKQHFIDFVNNVMKKHNVIFLHKKTLDYFMKISFVFLRDSGCNAGYMYEEVGFCI